MAGTAEVAKTAEKVRQVEEQLNHVRDAFSENEIVVGELVIRLSDVLKDEDVKEDASSDTPEISLCDLAARIRNVRRDIQNQNDRIGHVLQRLEL